MELQTNAVPEPQPSRGRNSWSESLALFLATGCWLGLIPWAPGTFGSLLGLPLAWGASQMPDGMRWALPIVSFLAGAVVCGKAAAKMGLEDPGAIVLDEITAFTVIFLFVPLNLVHLIAGFVLFRLFDITKPWPVRQFERLPGGWGIMADDLVAGLYARICLELIARWL
jgi:phosphatidylglycerophosphatase A